MSNVHRLSCLFLFLLLVSCTKEEQCPYNVYLGTFTPAEKSLSWNPYFEHSKVVFVDSVGKEFIFSIKDRKKIPQLTRRNVYKYCDLNDETAIVTYSYHADYEGSYLSLIRGELGRDSNLWLSVTIQSKLHRENPTEKNVGDFLSISGARLPYSIYYGTFLEFIVYQNTYPKIEDNLVSYLAEYNSNGNVYTNVYIYNKDALDALDSLDVLASPIPLVGKEWGWVTIYYTRKYGIIEMEIYPSGKKLFFKEFI